MRISWEQLWQNIQCCTCCDLGAGCIQKVPGQGDVHAPLMLIGEGPGEQEDRQGLAFVGPAGQLLTKMLSAIDLPRERVYICNVVKCRPPRNRRPVLTKYRRVSAICARSLRWSSRESSFYWALRRYRLCWEQTTGSRAAAGSGLNAKAYPSSPPIIHPPFCAIRPRSVMHGRI